MSRTTIEVRRPLWPVTRALLRIRRPKRVHQHGGVVEVEMGPAYATAEWTETEQCTVVTVHEPARETSVATSVFARLTPFVDRLEIFKDFDGEPRYRL